MFYLDHCLRQANVPTPTTVVIVQTPDESRVCRDLADEIRDLAPEASVLTTPPGEPVPACDLAVVPLLEPCRFPLEDVSYRRLDDLRRILPSCARARHVLLYRAEWREAEIIPVRGIARWLRRKSAEALALSVLARARSFTFPARRQRG